MDVVAALMQEQDGVIARRQALALGMSRTGVARLLRRREWVPVHAGVYVDHNGPLTWQQRAWAAVLSCGEGTALAHRSALRAAEGPGRRDADDTVIHVGVDRNRRAVPPDGVRVHRLANLSDRVQWNRQPPRLLYDEAILDVAADARDDLAAVGVLAAACGSRRTTAARLLTRLEARARIGRRPWLAAVLADVAEGTCSVLEHGYLTLVERPHGLPTGSRQVLHSASSGVVYRDVEHGELGLFVELDGRLFHSSAEERDRDLERDLDAAVDQAATTLRLGYAQVYARGCSSAIKVGAVMQRLGWAGTVSPCHLCGGSDETG